MRPPCPIQSAEDRDVGDVLAGRYPVEDRAGPNRDAGKIVPSAAAVLVNHVDNAIAFQCNIGAMLGLAQGNGHIVSSADMFIKQRCDLDVRQQIAAIRNEMLLAQERFDILNPAARPKNLWLMHEAHGTPAILSCGKELPERIRPMVGINYKRFYARVDQVIEDERDQRFLENGDQRLG